MNQSLDVQSLESLFSKRSDLGRCDICLSVMKPNIRLTIDLLQFLLLRPFLLGKREIVPVIREVVGFTHGKVDPVTSDLIFDLFESRVVDLEFDKRLQHGLGQNGEFIGESTGRDLYRFPVVVEMKVQLGEFGIVALFGD